MFRGWRPIRLEVSRGVHPRPGSRVEIVGKGSDSMRTQKKIAVVVMILLTGWAGGAWGDVAATVDLGLVTNTSFGLANSIGWRFFVDKEITITHLGLYDAGDDGLSGTHLMGIWRVKKEGGLRLERCVSIGPGGVAEDHHVYVALAEPLTIVPDPEPAVIRGIEYYERWVVGVWSPTASDLRSLLPPEAATLAIEQAGIIRFQNYTSQNFSGTPDTTIGDSLLTAQRWYPWTGTTDQYHFGVNFKYTVSGIPANEPPEAGDDSAVTQINTSVAVDVLANDSDSDDDSLSITDYTSDDSLSITGYTSGTYGSVMPVDGKLVYTPDRDFVGNDSFTYTTSDGQGGTAAATVFVAVIPGTLLIDIKPGSSPNSLNLGSNGVIPVAILSTEEFDATTLDPETIFLEGSGVAVRGKGNKPMSHAEDVNGDGMADLVVQIDIESLDPERFQDGSAVVTVEIGDQVLYQGDDEITTVPQ